MTHDRKRPVATKLSLTPGDTYNCLTVIDTTDKRNVSGSILWLFRCVCGNEVKLPATRVVAGTTYSCGCVKRTPAQVRAWKLRKRHDDTA